MNTALCEEVAQYVGTVSGRIVPGHGTLALIGTLASAFIRPGDHAVVPAPYGLYAQLSAVRGATIERVPLRELALDLDLDAMARAARERNAKIVWVCDPNNPTGTVVGVEEWQGFLDALPDGCVAVVDEAYIDYLPAERRVCGASSTWSTGDPSSLCAASPSSSGSPGFGSATRSSTRLSPHTSISSTSLST